MLRQPIITVRTYSFGHTSITLKGENYGDGIQDTEVLIGDRQLCWIHWNTKDEFIQELQAIVEKHRI